jgi:large conductance mechanosensitive channel
LGVLIGGVDFSELAITVKRASEVADAVTINYGMFVQTLINFTIVSFAIFLVIKAINAFKRKEEVAPTVPIKPSKEEVLLTEIRDLLKSGK